MGRLDQAKEQGDRKEHPKAIHPLRTSGFIHARKRSKYLIILPKAASVGGLFRVHRRLAQALAPIDRHHAPRKPNPHRRPSQSHGGGRLAGSAIESVSAPLPHRRGEFLVRRAARCLGRRDDCRVNRLGAAQCCLGRSYSTSECPNLGHSVLNIGRHFQETPESYFARLFHVALLAPTQHQKYQPILSRS